MKINTFRIPVAAFVLGSATFAVGMFSFSSPAHAWFDVCNKSTETVRVAFAYPENGGWTSHGWWRLTSGQCTTAYHPELKNRFYYVYSAGESGGNWGGNYNFCTIETEFRIANADKKCGTNGTWRGFAKVDTGKSRNFTYNLTE
ncbi:MAG: DUF1036 domain-containing protein [Planktothrix sp.]|uniref:DUF1036 domain-containing protein n=2 Tax=Planktothrix sp. TaxID=3088171 RepID=UPI0038D44984